MGAAGAGLQPEQLGRQVVGRTVARGGEGHPVRMGLQEAQHIGERLVRRVRRHHQHIGRLHQHRDVVEVLGGVVGHCLHQMRRDHQRAQRGHQEGLAVRRGALDLRRADRAGRAGPVVDHEGLVEALLQPGAERARHHVGGAARREGHQQRDRLGRPGLGLGGGGQQRQGAGRKELLRDLHGRMSPGFSGKGDGGGTAGIRAWTARAAQLTARRAGPSARAALPPRRAACPTAAGAPGRPNGRRSRHRP